MKGKKRGRDFLIFSISLITIAVYRIILMHLVGARGISYFSVPNELFFVMAGATAYGLKESVAVMVSNRMAKEQYESAADVVRFAIVTGLILSVLSVAVLYLVSSKIAGGIFHMPLSILSVMAVIPAVPLMIFTGVLRGFFDGTGYSSVSSLSSLLFIFLYAIIGAVLASVLKNYGVRVEAILRSEEYSFSYGALGASLGILISAFICFIHGVVMYFIFRRRTVYKGLRENSRRPESMPTMILNILVNALIPMALFFFGTLIFLLNEMMYFRLGEDAALFRWGEFYGKVMPAATLVIIPVCVSAFPFLKMALSSLRREEYRSAREGLGRMIHRLAGIGFFAAALTAVLAEDLLEALFPANGQETVPLLQLGAVIIAFAGFSVMLSVLSISLRYQKLSLVIILIAFVIHTILSIFLTKVEGMAFKGLVIADIVFAVLVAAASFIFICRVFAYTQEWLKSFAVTIISAAVASLIAVLFRRMIVPLTGHLMGSILTILVSTLVYMFVLLAFRGYTEEELLMTPLGRAMAAFGRAVHIL